MRLHLPSDAVTDVIPWTTLKPLASTYPYRGGDIRQGVAFAHTSCLEKALGWRHRIELPQRLSDTARRVGTHSSQSVNLPMNAPTSTL